MNPILFQIGPFAIRWYGVMMATMVLTGAAMAYRFGPRFGIPQEFLERITVPFVIVAFIGARIGYVLSHLAEFGQPLEILRIDHGGLSSHGAIIAGLLALWVVSRPSGISLWNLTDAIAWTIPLGNIFVRFGNFMNGELYGDLTTVPWAVRFSGIPGHRHPLQLYEMLWAGIILLVAIRLAYRRAFAGQIFWTVVVLSSLGRIFFDLFRSGDRIWGVLTLGHIPAILFTLIGLWFLATHRRQQALPPPQVPAPP